MKKSEIKGLSNLELARLIIKADSTIGRRFQCGSRSKNQILWNEWQERLINGSVNCHPLDEIKK
jgi:hypothetical protein